MLAQELKKRPVLAAAGLISNVVAAMVRDAAAMCGLWGGAEPAVGS